MHFPVANLRLFESRYPAVDRQPYFIDLDRWLNRRGNPFPVFSGRFSAVGCHGVIGKWFKRGLFFGRERERIQREIGRQISAGYQRGNHDLLFALGDNFYDDGLSSYSDKRFRIGFHDVYRLPTFAVLGNHDYKIHDTTWNGKRWWLGGITRFDTCKRQTLGMNQVWHTYSPRDNITDNWNMPNRYYALLSRRRRVLYVCLDSNTFPFDIDQQSWLYTTCVHFIHNVARKNINDWFIVLTQKL